MVCRAARYDNPLALCCWLDPIHLFAEFAFTKLCTTSKKSFPNDTTSMIWMETDEATTTI